MAAEGDEQATPDAGSKPSVALGEAKERASWWAVVIALEVLTTALCGGGFWWISWLIYRHFYPG